MITQNASQTKRTSQNVLVNSFDEDFNILAVELLGYDSDAGALVRLKTNASGEVQLDTTALDARYVNVTGDTMTGDLNTLNLIPTVDSASDLGSSAPLYFANAYIDKIYLNATATLDGATAGQLSVVGNIQLPDDAKILLGTGLDCEIYSSSDDLYIKNVTSNKDIIFHGNDGGVDKEILRLDSSGPGVAAYGAVVVYGSLSCPGDGNYSEKFGGGASADGAQGVAIGRYSQADGAGDTAVGYQAVIISSYINSTVFGKGATVTGHNATAIGYLATAAVEGVAIGMGASSAGQNAFALGRGAVANARQVVFGSTIYYVNNFYAGKGVISTSPSAFTINASGGSGTDIAGGALQLAGGKGTGDALGGAIIFLTSDAGASGTTLQSLTEKVRFDVAGNVGIGLTPTANMLGLSVEAGLLTIKETTAPTADANYGKLWTNTSDELWFQDGAGANHLLHGDAFSNIWFHGGSSSALTISTEDAFTLVDTFAVVGHEDDSGNVVGSTSTNNLTLSASGGGEYEISYHASITATGASKEIMTCVGITLATLKDITVVTDDTVSPIVITSTAHGLNNGDMVEIVGVLGNTAANGSFIVANKTTDTFEITTLDGSATTGNGDFDEGSPTGDVTIWYPGNMVARRDVSQTALGSMSATGLHIFQHSDVVCLYMANLDDTNNINIYAVSLDVVRIGD